VVEHDEPDDGPSMIDLDELCRVAARQMLGVALEAERRVWLADHAELVDAVGRRLVVGNGRPPERTIVTGAGEVEVCAPRVHVKRPAGERGPYRARRSCRPTCAARRR